MSLVEHMVCPWRRSEEIWNIWRTRTCRPCIWRSDLRKKRGVEPKIEKRQLEHYEEKKAIGQRAVDLVEDGEVIAIDLGTTTREFARALVGKKRRLTVITNSIPIALDLSVDENIRVIMVGGEVRKNELSVSGNIADENMRYFQTDKIFLGVGGLTEKIWNYRLPCGGNSISQDRGQPDAEGDRTCGSQ